KPRVKLFGFVAALLAGVVLVSVDEAGAGMLGGIVGGVIPTPHIPVATRDHRTPPPVVTRDHRTPPPVATRDHRTSTPVATRDHRTSTTVEVRDHRTNVEVRDHGTSRVATVPVTVTRTRRTRDSGSGSAVGAVRSTVGTAKNIGKKVLNTVLDPA